MAAKSRGFQYYADKAEALLTAGHRTVQETNWALQKAELYVRLAAAAPAPKPEWPMRDDD